MSHANLTQNVLPDNDTDGLLGADDAAEEIVQEDYDDRPVENGDEDSDDPMGDDDDDDEAEKIPPFDSTRDPDDRAGFFDRHQDSIFCIDQHPLNPSLVATGGGDDVAFLFDATLSEVHVPGGGPIKDIDPLQKLDGHTDSVNAIAFTRPTGKYVVTAGLDGKLRAWSSSSSASSSTTTTSQNPTPSTLPLVPTTLTYTFLAESAEVEEINWLAPNPSPNYPNVIALGASDGSVWVYNLDDSSSSNGPGASSPALSINQVHYLHTQSCTAGAWTPDGKLLATVSEDSSFHVYDVWGEAAASGVTSSEGTAGQSIISLTGADQRFAMDGGLYSIAISAGGSIAAVGGAGGQIRIVGLPRLSSSNSSRSKTSTGSQTQNQWGTLLASLHEQSTSVESLAFSAPPYTFLAAGAVDGTIALFEVAHRFALRRLIRDAHAGSAVVKVEFVGGGRVEGGSGAHGLAVSRGYFLTSGGMDGVVRRWDCRGGGGGDSRTSVPASLPPISASASTSMTSVTNTTTSTPTAAAAPQGLVREWRGHRAEDEGGGVLGFVQGGDKIVTAGDDGVSLVFTAEF